MTPERWARISELFEAALDVPEDQRASLVLKLCPGDPDLVQEVFNLLDHHARLGSFLGSPILDAGKTRTSEILVFDVGDLVANRYRITRPLGAGGMGVVFEAVDTLLDITVALKTLLNVHFQSAEFESRFRREITLARRVTHPNVCRIHDVGRHPHKDLGEIPFLSMEFIPGGTLSEHLRGKGCFAPEASLRIIRQIASGLAAAHEMGIVHRDLKSLNIMLDQSSGDLRAKITDFGIARSLLLDDNTVDSQAKFIGTPAYSAPERFRGETTKASDIYSLGVLIGEVLTGERPRAGETGKSRQFTDSRWNAIVAKCLNSDAACRFPDAGQLLFELDQVFISTLGPSPSPASIGSRGKRVLRPWMVALAVALVFFAYAAWQWRRDNEIYKPASGAQKWFNDAEKSFSFGDYSTATRELDQAVEIDPGFAIAHARLAAAWAELDFEGKADKELLSASSGVSRMSALNRLYFEGVRGFLTRDYALSESRFRDIARKIRDPDRRALAYLDLARLLERSGKVEDSVGAYTAASNAATDLPTPHLRIASLRSRQGRPKDATPQFEAARKLYEAHSDREGSAELAYEQGIAATYAGDMNAALRYIELALTESRRIRNPQLEVRALNRLSAIEFAKANDDGAIAKATEAATFARENDLPYWETEALIRLGSAYQYKSQPDSEKNLARAMQRAQDNHWNRLLALAQLNLANLRLDQNRPAETGQLAAAAADYYRNSGFFKERLQALTLQIRSKRDTGHLSEALALSRSALDVLQQYRNLPMLAQAEESTGNILSQMGDYPRALEHHTAALNARLQTGKDVQWGYLNCAEILWRLGRYDEANKQLGIIDPKALSDERFAGSMARMKAFMLLSRQRFGLASELASSSWPKFAKVKAELQIALALAKFHLGQTNSALPLTASAIQEGERQSDARTAADARLARSELLTALREYSESDSVAAEALSYYRQINDVESEWRTYLQLARNQLALHRPTEAERFLKKSLDTLEVLKHNWGSSAYTQYLSRPDIAALNAELQKRRR